ncbi:MAG: hypothetical protein RL459_1556 [Pseudomonadota bacterium]|jgi:hypothetical protein
MQTQYLQALVAAQFILPLTLCAAPLDALLSADLPGGPGQLRLELGVDAVNDTLDFLHLRSSDPSYTGTNVGDYQGQHVLASYRFTNDWSASGQLWRRRIDYRTDSAQIGSWQVAGQYRLLGTAASRGHLAVRLGVWGNASDELVKSSPTTVAGKTVFDVRVDSARDLQKQLDVVGTWRLSESVTVNALGGIGQSRVGAGEVSALYKTGSGCTYRLTFVGSALNGALVDTCSASGPVLDTFSAATDADLHVSYRANYWLLGGSLQWFNQDWMLRGGFVHQELKRAQVDDTIRNLGGVAYTANNSWIAEISRRIAPHSAVVLRGQLMSNQFVGDIPFAYNPMTAGKFGKRYGMATLAWLSVF